MQNFICGIFLKLYINSKPCKKCSILLGFGNNTVHFSIIKKECCLGLKRVMGGGIETTVIEQQ